MTEVRELAIELREIADAGHEVSGAADTMRQAASAIEALSAQVEELREALRDSYDALRRHCDWEADLIMSELEIDNVPAPTQAIWDKLTDDLQPYRNAAMDRAAHALASEQTGG